MRYAGAPAAQAQPAKAGSSKVKISLKAGKSKPRFSKRGGSSTYAGKLRPAKRNKADPYVAKGFKHVVETSGVVTDPDCLYVGHASYTPRLALEMVAQTILRRLFEKAGLTITALSDPLFPNAVNGTDGYFLRLEKISAAGLVTAFNYGVPASASILTITGNVSNGIAPTWGDLGNVLYDYAVGENPIVTNKGTDEPMQIRLFNEVIGTLGSRYNSECVLNLRDMFVNFSASSDIKIQNRSLSAGGSTDTDQVSANPLYCKKFLFNGVPRQKDKTAMVKIPPSLTGVLTLGAFNAGNTYMKEPVSPKLFWNCTKSSTEVIQPGQIKSDKIKIYKDMRLLLFLRWIGLMEDSVRLTNSIKGPFMMYALEDVINVNLLQVISIAYECNRVMGMFVYNRPRKFASGGVYQNTQDNLYVAP